MLNFYAAEVKWWNEYLPEGVEDETNMFIIPAETYTDAMEKINKRFPHIDRLTITEMGDDFLFINPDTYDRIIEATDKFEDIEL